MSEPIPGGFVDTLNCLHNYNLIKPILDKIMIQQEIAEIIKLFIIPGCVDTGI